MTDAARFWDKIAPKYAQDPIKDMAAYEYTLGRTRSYLAATDRVLELGCGTGTTAVQLAADVAHITGTDLSSAMIEIARERATQKGVGNADFRVHSAAQAAALDMPVNAVLGFNLFHLTQGTESLFADIHRLLPNGGYFISKTPCLADRAIGFKRFVFRVMLPVMQLFGKAPFVRFFTQEQLESVITSAGFDIVETGNFPAMSRYIVARKR